MTPQRTFALQSSFRLLTTLSGFLGFLLLVPGINPEAYAQVAPITSSGLNTQVSAPINASGGKVLYDITGGTRPGNGPNLFHSFGEFGVPTNNIANFLNDSGLATTNILSRVTGGNPSNIFGTLQTTGFGNANLFLMNPVGILFGPNATLNVGGSVNFTTADYLRLNDGARFTAIPGPQDAVLNAAPVAAFGFLGSNPAGISVQGSALSVPPGQSISLVGGNISIQAGTLEDGTSQAAHLSAPGGQIRLASVTSPGEILHPTLETTANINGETFSSMGTITVSGSATIDVSGDAAGTVKIRGGQLVIADATVSADTANANGAFEAVDINVTGDVSISDTRGLPAITARTVATGDAGEVRISSANLQATSSYLDLFALIDSHTSGTGRAGNVSITTGNLSVPGPQQTFFLIDSGIAGPGHGGDVTITAHSIQLDQTAISTGTFLAQNLGLAPTGPAGNLTITADSLQLKDSILITDAASVLAETQQAGDITINVRDINMLNGQISLFGPGRGGVITISADTLITDFTSFATATAFGPGGDITVNARVVELTNGSSLISSTFGDGNAGDIHLTATDHLSLVGVTGPNPLGIFSPSGLFSNSFGILGSLGNAGNILVTTPRLEMTEGRINTSTASSGRGGNVTINAGVISIAGEFPNPDFELELIFNITDIHPSGIFTKTVGSEFCSGPCGDAGAISITTGSLVMGSGSAIDSGTSSTGRGGDISINASGPISISGTLSDGTPSGIFSRTIGADPGSGRGGNIELQARQAELNNGASVSASSTGTGNAGNIQIAASDSLVMQNQSSITTGTTQSDGGDIHIQAGHLVQLAGSTITTSVQGGLGNGGNITIDPEFVVLQGSQVIANAFGGNGGNISIVAGVFFIDPLSVVSASSTLGISGAVNIQAPINNLSGTLSPLPGEIVQVAALLRAACAARFQGGNYSSFVVAGRDGMPLEPGGPLTIPLFAESTGGPRLAGSLNLPGLRVGRTFGDPDLALTALNMGCAS